MLQNGVILSFISYHVLISLVCYDVLTYAGTAVDGTVSVLRC